MGTIDEKLRFLKAKIGLVELRFYEVHKLEDELRKEKIRNENFHKRLVEIEAELRQVRKVLNQ